MLSLNEREFEISLKITESLEATLPLLCSLISTFKSVQMCQGLKPKYQTRNPTNGGVYCNGTNTREPHLPMIPTFPMGVLLVNLGCLLSLLSLWEINDIMTFVSVLITTLVVNYFP